MPRKHATYLSIREDKAFVITRRGEIDLSSEMVRDFLARMVHKHPVNARGYPGRDSLPPVHQPALFSDCAFLELLLWFPCHFSL